MERLRKRSEFLAVAKGRRVNRPAFTLQILPRANDAAATPAAADDSALAACRFGFTTTKKLGGAVVRNRIRRRLKEAVRLSAAALPQAGGVADIGSADIVVVGRTPALAMPFAELVSEMAAGLAQARRSLAPSRAKPVHPTTAHGTAALAAETLEAGRRMEDGHG